MFYKKIFQKNWLGIQLIELGIPLSRTKVADEALYKKFYEKIGPNFPKEYVEKKKLTAERILRAMASIKIASGLRQIISIGAGNLIIEKSLVKHLGLPLYWNDTGTSNDLFASDEAIFADGPSLLLLNQVIYSFDDSMAASLFLTLAERCSSGSVLVVGETTLPSANELIKGRGGSLRSLIHGTIQSGVISLLPWMFKNFQYWGTKRTRKELVSLVNRAGFEMMNLVVDDDYQTLFFFLLRKCPVDTESGVKITFGPFRRIEN